MICEKDKDDRNVLQITKEALITLTSDQVEELQTCVSKFLHVVPLFERACIQDLAVADTITLYKPKFATTCG
jgi:hypothetical protein